MTAQPQPAEFYRGFVADHYDLLVPDDEHGSFSFFEDAIRDGGEPALELACGTGRPIVPFRRAGLDVEGLDSSADMLERCRAKARAAGVEVTLHQQRMESFEVDRRFQTIFVVSSSFMLLPDDDSARRCLAAIRAHLRPGGRVLLALHVPSTSYGSAVGGDWSPNREAVREDGAIARCLARVDRFDERERVFESTLRYQLVREDRVEHEEDRSFVLHWYTQPQLRGLLEEAGFGGVRAVRGDWKDSQPDDRAFVFVGARPA